MTPSVSGNVSGSRKRAVVCLGEEMYRCLCGFLRERYNVVGICSGWAGVFGAKKGSF